MIILHICTRKRKDGMNNKMQGAKIKGRCMVKEKRRIKRACEKFWVERYCTYCKEKGWIRKIATKRNKGRRFWYRMKRKIKMKKEERNKEKGGRRGRREGGG